MKALLTVTAAVEVGAGAALALFPSATATLLLGSPLEGPAALTLGRVTGAALAALGVACWGARHDGQGGGAAGLRAAMPLYNIAVVAILASGGLWSGLHGIGLWPAVAVHAALTAWWLVCLLRKP